MQELALGVANGQIPFAPNDFTLQAIEAGDELGGVCPSLGERLERQTFLRCRVVPTHVAVLRVHLAEVVGMNQFMSFALH